MPDVLNYFSVPHSEVLKFCIFMNIRIPQLASNDNRRCHMYAIIATGGKQYKVAEGDIIKVEKLGVEAGSTVSFDQVLVVNKGELVVGNPTVANATVTATVVEEGKNKKVIVYRYKRKTGYHKKNGHRQPYTKVKIEKINA
jgi:large subunit ribosomal protein L21